MRNLREYPVTKEEVAECLHNLSWEYAKLLITSELHQFKNEEAVGDMTAYILRIAALSIEKFGIIEGEAYD